MNYLSHHFFYKQDKEPYFNVGLILPDFSRSAAGRRKLLLEDIPNTAIYQSLKRGCEGHYEADDWFHRCDFFTEMSHFLDKEFLAMENAGLLQGQRKWFMTHIFTEMLLDRHIMDHFPDSLDEFYNDLANVELETLVEFLRMAGKDEFDSFRKHFNIFCEVQYLYHYATENGLVQSLDRMLRRTGQPQLQDKSLDYITNKIPAWLERVVETKKPRQMARLVNNM